MHVLHYLYSCKSSRYLSIQHNFEILIHYLNASSIFLSTANHAGKSPKIIHKIVVSDITPISSHEGINIDIDIPIMFATTIQS